MLLDVGEGGGVLVFLPPVRLLRSLSARYASIDTEREPGRNALEPGRCARVSVDRHIERAVRNVGYRAPLGRLSEPIASGSRRTLPPLLLHRPNLAIGGPRCPITG